MYQIIPGKNSGFILFITLVVMVIMSVAGMALMKNVIASNALLNNLAARQAAVLASDRAIEDATRWLMQNRLTLGANNAAAGYSAVFPEPGVSGTGVETPTSPDWYIANALWDNSRSVVSREPGALTDRDSQGNVVRYKIYRLCSRTGSFAGREINVFCVTSQRPLTTKAENRPGGDKGVSGVADNVANKTYVYFRILVRTTGLRGVTTYSQSTIMLDKEILKS